MDGSRKSDLEQLDKMAQGASVAQMRDIAETRQKIVIQSRDPQLTNMREQLVRAVRGGNGQDVKIMNMRIKEYTRRGGY